MNIKNKLHKELFNFFKHNIKLNDYFVCIYGSYATKYFRKNSDLDIIVFTKNYNRKEFLKIRNFIISLHINNGLTIDEEVPYESKLLVSYVDIESAIQLGQFLKDKSNSEYYVPSIKNNSKSLRSRNVRLRLILNLLTSPHIFVYGNRIKYKIFKKESEKAIIKLIFNINKNNKLKKDKILKSLLVGKKGETGRFHLGYKGEREEVVNYLKKLINRNLI